MNNFTSFERTEIFLALSIRKEILEKDIENYSEALSHCLPERCDTLISLIAHSQNSLERVCSALEKLES